MREGRGREGGEGGREGGRERGREGREEGREGEGVRAIVLTAFSRSQLK